MNIQSIKNDWAPLLKEEFEKLYFLKLHNFVSEEYKQHTVYPNIDNIFNALHYTSFKDVKVVILGQDPYHGENQAHGLSFSVKPEVAIPPSLRNIFKELHDDVGYNIPNHGYLLKWAEEGVLLLNDVLTVRHGEAHSHQGKGWENFTNRIIELLNDKDTPIVYILWGAAAQKKKAIINREKHYIIESPHPSPLSAYRGFFGSKPFSKTNQLLRELGHSEIDWDLDC